MVGTYVYEFELKSFSEAIYITDWFCVLGFVIYANMVCFVVRLTSRGTIKLTSYGGDHGFCCKILLATNNFCNPYV